MKYWEIMEDYLFGQAITGEEFTNRDVADEFDCSSAKASALIQAYLDAQVSKSADTSFVLTRRGRTTNAVWHAGFATQDARDLYRQTWEDIQCRVERFVLGTLESMGVHNPRAIPTVTSIVKMLEGVIEFSAASAGGEARKAA